MRGYRPTGEIELLQAVESLTRLFRAAARRGAAALAASLLAMSPAAAASPPQQVAAADLSQLSIEQLAQVKITSVSKTPQPLSQAAAAVYVITQDKIRRSGANSIPEILRLAPNLQVARSDANTYAITARGFNETGGTANKLLVLIDGRAVYSPLFSGTFWDQQRTVIADIDRIEVISGPGGTLWGANAVNGVINIITKSSAQTQGLLVNARAGSLDNRIDMRFGGKLGETGTFRVYGIALRQGAMERPDGTSARDGWDDLQGGFRADWSADGDTITLQGDIYNGTGIGLPAVKPSGSISGANISAIWSREFADGSVFKTQAYFDNSKRELVSGIAATVNQYSFDAQYSFDLGDSNSLVAGAGYRVTQDHFRPGPGTVFTDPARRTLQYGNLFLQDAIALSDSLKLTLGLKLETNSYTGLEYMPEARLAWNVSDKTLLWAAVSRAVRTPSRFDTDLINPGILQKNPSFTSEDLIAYEAGYRGLLLPSLSLSVSGYYNSYSKLRTVEASGAGIFPLIILNNMRGDVYGVEVWADYAVTDWWRLGAGFNAFEKNLSLAPGSLDLFGVGFAGNDPDSQFQLHSAMDLPHDIGVDLQLRNVASLGQPSVSAYWEADARVSWQAADNLELALSGQNLLHSRHLEFVNPSLPPSEIPRSVSLELHWEL